MPKLATFVTQDSLHCRERSVLIFTLQKASFVDYNSLFLFGVIDCQKSHQTTYCKSPDPRVVNTTPSSIHNTQLAG